MSSTGGETEMIKERADFRGEAQERRGEEVRRDCVLEAGPVLPIPCGLGKYREGTKRTILEAWFDEVLEVMIGLYL